MFGKTESTINPSYGKASMVNEFDQFLYDISTKKMMKRDTIARIIANTPITDKYLSFSIFSMRTAGASKRETIIIMNQSEM
jgi:hypothetical protein